MNLDCIILAGGKSKRMGRDKAFLPFKNKTFLRNILETLDSFCSRFLIVVNKDFDLYRKEIQNLKTPVIFIRDLNPYDGPLNGIVSALNQIKSDRVFIGTCDTPILSKKLLSYLLEKLENFDAVIPEIDGKIQPLNTFYSKNALEKALEVYQDNKKSLMAWLDKLNYKIIHKEEIITFDKEIFTYKSINTPDMYKWLLKVKK